MTTKNKNPVWFITGCSTGFGRELATQTLARGFRVVVTARKPAEVEALAATGEALVLKLDVAKQSQIDAAIKAAEKKFGGIDVLVNNAGIGYFAAIEEGEDKEVRRMFEINVRQAFEENRAEKMFSKTLVETLCAMNDRQWPEANRGKPITESWLARHLRAFSISSRTLRIGESRAKGYELADFAEIFERYLPAGVIKT